ncbi:hypothetical protein WJX72_006712 [[Myrmecia] bisecta]|uniref:Uncharacterized protein n=1 Tax=[Myrmecia] bisecta TaxID=41462 RepID=A0AAW1R6I0_9CHLO
MGTCWGPRVSGAESSSGEPVSQKLHGAAHKIHSVAHDTKKGVLRHLSSGLLRQAKGVENHTATGFQDLPMENLRHLAIAHYDLHSFEEAHASALSAWQHLHSLRITNCTVQPPFIQMLECVLPRLTHLHIWLDNDATDAIYSAVHWLAQGLGTHGKLLQDVDIRLPNKGDEHIPMALLAELSSARSIRLGRAEDINTPFPPPFKYAGARCCQLTCTHLELGRQLPLRLQASEAIVQNSALQRLSVHVIGGFPSDVSRLRNLTSLFLGLHQLDSRPEDTFRALGQLVTLKCLQLGSDEAVNDACVARLESLTALTQLTFSSKFCEPALSRRSLASVAKLVQLRHLEATSSLVLEEADLALLAPLTRLQHLDVGTFTCFTNQAMQLLQPLGALRRLWLRVPREVMFAHQKETVQHDAQRQAI